LISEQLRKELRYVQTNAPALSLDRFPDFFIIGPQRTGTTWLHANLRWHPEIFLAEPKELFYFSRLKTPEHPKFQSADLGWYLSFFKASPWLYAVEHLMALREHRRFYRPKARGEATASYAAMDEDVIAELALLNPNARIIMMVRDPIQRAWSHAKKDLSRNRQRDLKEVSDAEFQAFFSDPYQVRCADYEGNLRRWRNQFPAEQVLALSYDDVSRRPADLLIETMQFLGVDSSPTLVPADAAATVNPTSGSKIPEQHLRYLEDLLADSISSWKTQWSRD
jgi:hypothetical protein